MSCDVFVSHIARDRAAAEAACEAIERDGHFCWMAPRDAGAGGSTDASLAAIGRCKIFLLILSEESAAAGQVAREAERARRSGLAIIPLRIEAVEPEGQLEHYLADATPLDAMPPPLADHLGHLTAMVGRILDGGEGAALRPLTLPPGKLRGGRRPGPAWLPIAIAWAAGMLAIAVVAAVAAHE